MNKIALLLVGLMLGQIVPASAHAQLNLRAPRIAIDLGLGHVFSRNADDAPDVRVALMQQGRQEQQGGQQTVRLISLNQITAQIQRSTPGKLLDATPPDPSSPRPVYRIRWQADNGQRIDFVVDAQTGAILSRNGG
jgi:uncharacterized membrane protein YkoI